MDCEELLSLRENYRMKYCLNDDDTSLQHLDKSLQHLDESLQHLPNVKEVKKSKKAAKELVIKAILEACVGRYLTALGLATLLNRDIATIRNHYLSKLVKEGSLELKYEEVNHKNQAYITKGQS